MNCTRCGIEINEVTDGWVNCSKCGLSKFVGIAEEPKEEKPVEEEKKNEEISSEGILPDNQEQEEK